MKMTPTPTVTRFEQLNPGDLFFVEIQERSCVALKAVDDERDGDTLMVVLGPYSSFNEEVIPGILLSWKAATVVSFSNEFTVSLPTEPEDWTTTAPADGVLPLVISDGDIYVRAVSDVYGRRLKCFVKISNGRVIYQPRTSISAYALKWGLAIVDERGELHPILRMEGPGAK